MNNSVKTAEAYSELVLKQLAYATDTTVTKVVDVVNVADTLGEAVHIVD